MANDLAAQLRAELIRTSVGHDHTTSGTGGTVDVRLPASHLHHFGDILGDRADDIVVTLRLDPTAHLVEAMKAAPDLWAWGAANLLRRRRHDDDD